MSTAYGIQCRTLILNLCLLLWVYCRMPNTFQGGRDPNNPEPPPPPSGSASGVVFIITCMTQLNTKILLKCMRDIIALTI